MKRFIPFLIAALIIGAAALSHAQSTTDGNVYHTGKDGAKYFVCPVMGNHAQVTAGTKFTDHDGKRYYYCCPGCKPKFEANSAIYLDKLNLPANVTMVDADGKQFVCPACGMESALTKTTVHSDHDGGKYYFCSDNCKVIFDQKPAKFIKGLKKKMSAASSSAKHNCESCGSSHKCGM